MTKTNKKCNDNCACSHVDAKITGEKTTLNYGFYSRVLNKPFDSLSELMAAEAAYYDELKVKEDAAAQKKADAQKVEDAFKALNAARKEYKEKLAQLTTEYSEELTTLKKAFELGKEDLRNILANAEDAYSKELKNFTAKYDNYHMTLKDGDFETTLSGSKSANTVKTMDSKAVSDLFNMLFGW